jgi:glycosyltransferase involved in cell wall biosynthesis/peptidoglycan/xylan/chitin deacetylase (PgdA/CDA1 family)
MPDLPAVDPITILIPCKDQKREFFEDALGSLIRQTSPHWEALVLTSSDPPPHICEWTRRFSDPRIRICPRVEPGFAGALNTGLREARTEFVSILLSDDRYAPNAIETLLSYHRRLPEVDFFHTASRIMDEHGAFVTEARPPRRGVTLEHFTDYGSPVKHLLCWRRSAALAIGGFDPALSPHGCDDYDFPWRMFEAGVRFQAITECLYEYRIHRAHSRLTTDVSLEEQVATLRAIFRKHAVAEMQTDRFLQRASRYLVPSFTAQVVANRGRMISLRYSREATSSDRADFVQAGIKQRWFFPHRVYTLPKGGPDGLKLARRMTGCDDPGKLREFVLYALDPVAGKFPRQLYFDDDLQWHQQQFGLTGQVAVANVMVGADSLYCYTLISDLVQRISRAQAHRTQIDNRFQGWPRLLLSAVLRHALESGYATVHVPCSELVLRNTDRRRNPKPELYQRIYDQTSQHFGGEREGEWWRIPVKRERIGPLRRSLAVDPWPKTVCVIHDIERGLGHLDSDPEFARQAEAPSAEALNRMLAMESRMGVSATYNVVGELYQELQGQIRQGGHAIAFHSYDHRLSARTISEGGYDGTAQLRRCRQVDYRLKGYRPPQSRILPGIDDANLSEFNFEWLASSVRSLGATAPFLENGIAKIPVNLDDYPMHRGELDYEAWEAGALDLLERRDLLVIGLHDCYAHHWLDRYELLLGKLREQAELSTLDDVASRLFLGGSYWFENNQPEVRGPASE